MPENDRGFGSKLKGLFFENDGEQAPSAEKSPAEMVAELAQNAAPPEAPLAAEKMSVELGATPNFEAIFTDAGMDPVELDQVKKAEELLKALPESTPQDVKRQIVEASLKTFGTPVEKIVQAAQNQNRALDTYVRVNDQVTQKAINEAEAKIKGLHEQIAGLKADIDKRSQHLTGLAQAAGERKTQVQRVLDFFDKSKA